MYFAPFATWPITGIEESVIFAYTLFAASRAAWIVLSVLPTMSAVVEVICVLAFSFKAPAVLTVPVKVDRTSCARTQSAMRWSF